MSQTNQVPPRIECVDTEDRLLALKEPWTALTEADPCASVFQTWQWSAILWHQCRSANKLWTLTAWDGGGRLIGVAPWMLVKRRAGPLLLKTITFLASRFAYGFHLDVIARSEQKEMVCRAFIEYLQANRGEWDVLDMRRLAADSVLSASLTAALGRCMDEEGLTGPYIPLPGDWDTYSKTLTKKLRRNLKYFSGLLERESAGPILFQLAATPADLAIALDSLVAMSRIRWGSEGLRSNFEDASFCEFHCEMAAAALAQGWLRMYQLSVDNRVIAVLYCFRYHDKYFAYQTAFDLAWSRYSPGRLLISHAIRSAIEEGVREFDWLSGADEYKFEWAETARVDHHVVWSLGWRGHFGLLAAFMIETVMAGSRKLLPERVRQRLNQVGLCGRRSEVALAKHGP